MPDDSQFHVDRGRPGRWSITFGNPPINMCVATTIRSQGGRGCAIRTLFVISKINAEESL